MRSICVFLCASSSVVLIAFWFPLEYIRKGMTTYWNKLVEKSLRTKLFFFFLFKEKNYEGSNDWYTAAGSIVNELDRLQNQLIHLVRSRVTTINSDQNTTKKQRYTHRSLTIWNIYGILVINNSTVVDFVAVHNNVFFKCLVCSCEVVRSNVGVHGYSSERYDVICPSCVNSYRNHG
jgi:hypothetical protein